MDAQKRVSNALLIILALTLQKDKFYTGIIFHYGTTFDAFLKERLLEVSHTIMAIMKLDEDKCCGNKMRSDLLLFAVPDINNTYSGVVNFVRCIKDLYVPLEKLKTSCRIIPHYIQRIAAKIHFLWLQWHRWGGGETFVKSRKTSKPMHKISQKSKGMPRLSEDKQLFHKYFNDERHFEGYISIPECIHNLSVVIEESTKCNFTADLDTFLVPHSLCRY